MPGPKGVGDDTESGQVIPLRFSAMQGNYIHALSLDGLPTIAGGQEI